MIGGLRRSFLTKVILALYAVSSIGVLAGTYLATQRTMDRLLTLENNYNEQQLREDAVGVAGLFDRILSLFVQVYIPDHFGFSLESLLSNASRGSMPAAERLNRIQAKLETMGQNYGFIRDVGLVDYVQDDFYFFSASPGRARKLQYDYRTSALLTPLRDNPAPITVLPPHLPDYVLGVGTLEEPLVFSVCLHIFDTRRSPMGLPIGTLIVNIRPDIFAEVTRPGDDHYFDHRVLVAIADTNEVIYDSAHGNRAATEVFVRERWGDEDFLTSELIVEGGYVKLITILEKSQILRVHRDTRLLIVRIGAVTVLFLLATSLLLSRMITRRLSPLSTMMDRVKHGDLMFRIPIRHRDEVAAIEEAFNDMCQKLDTHIREVYLSKLRFRTAQLRLLQNQMNPHFMYNTLQSIQMNALMHQDRETAEMTRLLAEVFRWALDDTTVEVPLNEEIHYLRVYTRLQSIRFEESISLDIDIPRTLGRCSILKLALQPLVENAIQHGLKNRSGGHITVSGCHCGRDFELSVADDGTGINESEIEYINELLREHAPATEDDGPGRHIGLRNVHSRLRMFYADAEGEVGYGITGVQNRVGGGVEVTLRIPLVPRPMKDRSA